ncbi:hypothetical protein UFOVP609_3 [uncultured Caudovirales phage]|uniref:Uncharacterized protein n=1 Tax=uncultured Caudovirales phage TaxID=2100421 RepID=A0A6J5N2W1_9CAUD|nr:hypothetical protein UFOVP609_3 [uncultured Caudovirales phage]
MAYINPSNEYPRYYGDIQLDNPGWKLGDQLPTGWHEVKETPMPTVEANKVIEELAPELVENEYVQAWNVRPMTAEEIERRDAPETAKAKLKKLGLTDIEIEALARGLVR